MSGVLPAIARQNGRPGRPTPHTLELRHSSWLGPASAQLRGYLGDRWQIVPTGPLRIDDQSTAGLNLVGRHQAIGSRVQLNFATDPAVIDRFFAPHATALELSGAAEPISIRGCHHSGGEFSGTTTLPPHGRNQFARRTLG